MELVESFVRTDEGLLVPADAIESEREVWNSDDARLLRRAIKLLAGYKIRAILICEECQGEEKQFVPEAALATINDPATNHLMLVCGHKNRLMGLVK